MQALYNALLSIAQALKSRFGYAITIKQAVLGAYFLFLVGVFVQLTGFISLAYTGLATAFPAAGAAAVQVFPNATIVSGGVTAYIGALIFKKTIAYTMLAWSKWTEQTRGF